MRTIRIARWAAALALAAPFALQAAGLGRLTVLSTLGAPLSAEIEIVALQPGEEDGLTARLASGDAFRQAGIEASAALSTMRFAIARRDGRPVIRITSTQPVNEPFVDLLVELEAKTGRLVREYTFLLDPPGYRGNQAIAAAPAATTAARPASKPASEPAAQPQPATEARPLPAAEAPQPAAAAPAARAEEMRPAPAAGASSYEVRRGDTLGAIARANLPVGVSLNQMLIAIYRSNQDAFLRENINLVRAGRVLVLPTAEEAAGVTTADANRLVQSHRAEWDEYRSRLAARPAPAEAASGQRAVSGRIEAGAEAPRSGEAQDQVRLAQADPAKPAAAARAARGDDAAARERALKEAQSRVSDLEKNVADLQKLLELKNQQLAELEKKAGAVVKPQAAKPEAVKPEPVKPVAEAPKPAAEAPKPAAEAPKPAAEAPKPAATPAPPVEAKKAEPAPEAKKAEPAKPKPKAVTAPAQPAPSLLDEFLDNPVTLIGAGAIVLLLLGYAGWSWRRKKSGQAKFSDSVIGPGAAGASAGGSGADAASGIGSQASVSQASGMEAEEVDPIAEADVYMAYGRDAQAEEILREALQKDPGRLPVHAKLLEIYAKRGDAKAFEQAALKVKSLTNANGPDWDKAVALGRSIDPANGLYGAAGAAVAAAASSMAAAAAAVPFGATTPAPMPTIDFDVGAGSSPGMVSTDIPLDDASRPATPSTIDFDLGAVSKKIADPDATVAALDFELNTGLEENKPAPAPLAAAAAEPSGLDFDLNLDLGDDKPAADKPVPPMDLSSISLDLGSAGEPGASTSSNDPKWQEVATKLDLAKAYEEMGDRDGARELLGEVMKDGDATQKGQAQQLLTKLG